ncbi:MAG: hypothetical protein NC177_02090 [Ruminococcus flavefaciens]|nr:hypothetical protein [Ruminococcus flavefaciens]
MNDIYDIFSHETILENKKVIFFILIAIDCPDMFSAIKQIFIPECYETIAFKLDTENGIYFKYAFRVAIMNPEFKASDIEDISNRDFVMKHISSLYEDELKKTH